jgi:prephenate dehydrogenase
MLPYVCNVLSLGPPIQSPPGLLKCPPSATERILTSQKRHLESMKKFDSIAIVGVGLIGASIGLAVRREKLAGEIVGIGRRASSLRKAKACGAVDRTTTNLERGVAGAELVIVCTPVELIVEQVQRIVAAVPGALVTDAGSTKELLVGELGKSLPRDSHFVGSHPMAGSENTGPEHGTADLLEGRTVVVTPSRKSLDEDVQRICDFWAALGAGVLRMTPKEHDRAVAATSHLPHLLASAIAGSTPEDYFSLVSTGWLDTTRIAAGDAALWRQIFMSNRENVLRSLARLEKSLGAMRGALERQDAAKLEKLLEQAKRTRDALGS